MSHSDIRRTALITGGSRGLGSAIALEHAATGANVAVNYFKNDEAAQRICERIRRNAGRAHAFKADVRHEGEIVRLVHEVVGIFGAIDILVVNATGPQPFLLIEEQTWESYLDQLEFFVKSPLLLLKQVLPGMKGRGFGRSFKLAARCSKSGIHGLPTMSLPRERTWD